MEKIMESEHIYYVKVTEELVNDYLEMVNDPEVQRFISKNMFNISYENEINWVHKKLLNNDTIFSMIEKETGKFIGNIEIMHIHNNIGELGISITSKMQDKHYGTEAIKRIIDFAYNELKLVGMELNVYDYNERAIHCYENVGFVQDGPGKTDEDIHMSFKR